MRVSTRLLAASAALAVPVMALAQPVPPPQPQPAQPQPVPAQPAPVQPAPVDPPAPQIDESKVKEIVDREVARILTERAQKDAADKAAKEAQDKETTAAQPASDISGAGGFMDTRLAFTLTNENVLVKPGETIPSVPGWRFGTPNSLGVLFFDNYDTRYSGFETLSHAVMYRDFRHGHLEAEGALVVRINELSGSNISLADDGTYIQLTNWKDPSHKDPTRISLTAFPVSADRFRLGYSYRLSWGGDPEYSRARASTPGMKIQFDTDGAYAFIGAKSAVVLDRRTAEDKSALAALAGGGIDPTPWSRIEINGGIFDRGFNELQDVNDQHVILYGASVQASIHKGMPLRSSVDYKLYKNNGENVSNLFLPESYPGGFSWLAQSEFTVLGQTLKDPDKTGSTKRQYGMAGDLNIRAKYDRFKFQADFSYRDLAFILHSVPSLPTYEDFPGGTNGYKVSADLFGDIGVSRNWDDWLTLGLVLGVEKPATLESPIGIPGDTTVGTGKSTAVIRNNNVDTLITILPQNKSVVPQFALKGNVKVDFGRIYAAILEVYYSYDGNTTRYQRVGCADPSECPDAPFEYVFGEFNQLGVNATLQARF